MTPTCPKNHLIVVIDKKFKEDILTESGIRLYQDTSYRPEWHATVIGKVISVPRSVDGMNWDLREKLKHDIKPGDEVAFSYLVVFDLEHKDDEEEVFYEDPMPSPFLAQYSNRLGMKIVTRYRPQDDLFDVALYDRNGMVHELKEKQTILQKDDFFGNYRFASTNQISYNNLVELAGKEYWMVDLAHVLAVKRGNELTPMSGKAILSKPEMTMEDHEEAGIVLMNKTKPRNTVASKIIALGEPLIGEKHINAEPGDRVIYDKSYAEEYELWDTEVLVLPHRRLLAKI